MNSQQRSQEIKVGIVSILAVLLFIIGITLGRGWNVSVATQTIKFRFQNSGGIQEGSPIVVNGVKRGTVTSVKNDRGSVLILASIDNYDDFKSDASGRTSILEITGGKKIEINPGTSAEKFDKNNEIPGSNAADIGELVAMLGDVGSDAKLLVRRFDTIAYSANRLLADGKVVADMRRIIENTDKIAELLGTTLEKRTGDINAVISSLKELSGGLKKFFNEKEPKFREITDKLDLTLDDAQRAIGDARGSIQNINSLAAEAQSLIREINSGDGLVSRLIKDPELSRRLDSTFNNLNQLLSMIKEYGVNVNLRLGTRP